MASMLYSSDDMRQWGLPAWPAGTVVDLRSTVECVEAEHPLASHGATVHRLPLMADEDITGAGHITQYRDGLAGLYRSMVTDAGARFADLLRAAADGDGPVLVHCAAGKDRTGVSVAMLLSLAGVDRAAVVADYVRTEADLPAVMERLRGHSPAYAVPEGLEEFMGSPAHAIEAVLDLWDAHPGGVRGWIGAQGADEAVIERWITRVRES
ncbi:tyrosine-protein phosphatase [Streptomyces sp. FIT100]|nr:tyrosine-protein phosphatase [Streptomyces sp. FIT100]